MLRSRTSIGSGRRCLPPDMMPVAPRAGIAFLIVAAGILVGSVTGRYHYSLDALTGAHRRCYHPAHADSPYVDARARWAVVHHGARAERRRCDAWSGDVQAALCRLPWRCAAGARRPALDWRRVRQDMGEPVGTPRQDSEDDAAGRSRIADGGAGG